MTGIPTPDALAAETPAETSAEECDCEDGEACYICVPCDVCRDGEEECGCDGEFGEDCSSCYGSGYHIPEHCCECGGSPYCVKCHTCGHPCAGDCKCPVTVQLEGGRTLTLA
ncbi:hypothetical protein Aple_010370 [Acrocarpospora pleiomorpha]|uniref:Uncharacterized protein n=1 Tax=Acrocarpospora pleiomorpha TaxID=90975 RepID=A0A5M3XBK4_9ACTN|nr:hypothetical protein [Acrocarpospora pleiomorpha]GES18142.1 hypothetical protein Aple_010370 [Acrocarpospora pleiomorpha]